MAAINASPSTTVEKPTVESKEYIDGEDPDAGLSDEEREAIVCNISPASDFYG
jgi:hypothetical protein